LGTGRDAPRKAESDFARRVQGIDADDPVETFVFVTSRNWTGKDEWAAAKRREGPWENVEALDASDLEAWFEESVEGQVWMAEQLGLASLHDCMTLDRAWDRWSEASDPPMTEELFAPAVAEHRGRIVSWLRSDPPDRPLYVAADSKEEALAFLACVLRGEGVPADVSDRAVVVNSARTVRTLAPSTSRFVPIVAGKEAECELASAYRQRHSIVVRPRNAVDREPDVRLASFATRPLGTVYWPWAWSALRGIPRTSPGWFWCSRVRGALEQVLDWPNGHDASNLAVAGLGRNVAAERSPDEDCFGQRDGRRRP
jgi:hypothetical protein